MVASDDVGANLSADAAAASLMSLARRPMVNVMSIMENSKRVERNQRQTKGRQAGKAKIVAGKTRASKPPAKVPPNRKDVGSASAQHAVDLGKSPEKSGKIPKKVEKYISDEFRPIRFYPGAASVLYWVLKLKLVKFDP